VTVASLAPAAIFSTSRRSDLDPLTVVALVLIPSTDALSTLTRGPLTIGGCMLPFPSLVVRWPEYGLTMPEVVLAFLGAVADFPSS